MPPGHSATFSTGRCVLNHSIKHHGLTVQARMHVVAVPPAMVAGESTYGLVATISLNDLPVPERQLICTVQFAVSFSGFVGPMTQTLDSSASIDNAKSGSIFAFAFKNPGIFYDQAISITSFTVALNPVPEARSLSGLSDVLYTRRTRSILATIDDPAICDCLLLAKDSTVPVSASRAVLVHASTFFATMFKGPWAESAKLDKPINFGWTISATIPCLIHIYSCWLPGEPLPNVQAVNDLLAKHALDLDALTLHQLHELLDLALMLELVLLA